MNAAKTVLRRLSLFVVASVVLATGSTAAAAEDYDIVFVIDGSGSINSAEFTRQKEGVKSCLCGPDARVPINGTVAIAVIRFSDAPATVIPLRVLAPANIHQTCNDIMAITQAAPGGTNLPAALQAAESILGGPAALGESKTVILATDAGEGFNLRTGLSECESLRTMSPPVRVCTAGVASTTTDCGKIANFLNVCANTSASLEHDPAQPEGIHICTMTAANFVDVCRHCVCATVNPGQPDCDNDGIPDMCEASQPSACPETTRAACCDPISGSCADRNRCECESFGGVFNEFYLPCRACTAGINTGLACDEVGDCPGGQCAPAGTTQCAVGACCEGGGICVDGTTPSACGGAFQGYGTDCNTNCCADSTSTGADECQSASVRVLEVGSQVAVAGNNAAATGPDGCSDFVFRTANPESDPGWWEAFQIGECADVRIDLCCEDVAGAETYNFLYEACPCGRTIQAAQSGYGAPICPGGNAWTTFNTLPAGTYYYPVFAGSSDERGPYVVHITTTPCEIGACCTSTTCTVTDRGDCARDGGFFKGGQCFGNTCATGACCTAPGTCKDYENSIQQPTTPSTCGSGVFTGGAKCFAGRCNNNNLKSCRDNADCPGGFCQGGIPQQRLPIPCPICNISTAEQCQQRVTTVSAAISDLSSSYGLRRTDDFVPESGTLSTVCVWGTYFNPGASGGDIPGPSCESTIVNDFRVTVYADAGGVPGAVLATRQVTSANLLRAVEIDNTTGLDITQYRLTLQPPISGLTPGACHWLEVVNNTTSTPTTCDWYWLRSDGSGNDRSMADANSIYEDVDAVPYDLAFCLNVAFEPGACGIERGSCCNSDSYGTCSEVVSRPACSSRDGVYYGPPSECSGVECEQPGACCDSDSGLCVDRTRCACAAIGGIFQGDGIACRWCDGGINGGRACRNDLDCPGASCIPIGIEACESGACCSANGSCLAGQTPASCTSGTFRGYGTVCQPNDCLQPVLTGGDSCNDADVHVITVPGLGEDPVVITISGDNSTATGPDTCDGAIFAADGPVQDPGWWEAFQLTDCAMVRIDLCGTDAIGHPSWTELFDSCPCGCPTKANETGRGYPHCLEDNVWAEFGPLRAGTYYFPIYAAHNYPRGEYQAHITVSACPQAACCVDSQCIEVNRLECDDAGGFFHAPPNRSMGVPLCLYGSDICDTGSCCYPSGHCYDGIDDYQPMTEARCEPSGDYIGGIACEGSWSDPWQPSPCRAEACCLPDGSCRRLTRDYCLTQNGLPRGADTECRGDGDGSGIDDACEPQVSTVANAEPVQIAKSRFLSFAAGDSCQEQAVRVKLVSLYHPNPPLFTSRDFTAFEGQYRWLGPPIQALETYNPLTYSKFAPLQCTPHFMDWHSVGLVHVYGAEVMPSSVYEIQVLDISCADSLNQESFYSAPLVVNTGRWGDIVAAFQVPGGPPGSATQPNALDVAAVVDKFKGVSGAVILARAKMQPNIPSPTIGVNVLDIVSVVDSFKGFHYPYAGPSNCP